MDQVRDDAGILYQRCDPKRFPEDMKRRDGLRPGDNDDDKFYRPGALADGNQRIQITEKTLEFSSTVLSALSPYRPVCEQQTVTDGSATG